MTQLQLMLISTHPLWGQLCHDRVAHHLQGFHLHLLISEGVLEQDILRIQSSAPDLILVSLTLPYSALTLIRALQSSDCCPAIIILCSHDALSSPSELEDLHLSGVVPSSARPNDLIDEIQAVAANRPGPLLQQYLQGIGSRTRASEYVAITERDRDILLLIAAELTDKAIADTLHLSPLTISTYLHDLYSKLGVKGRIGAVRWAIRHGILRA